MCVITTVVEGNVYIIHLVCISIHVDCMHVYLAHTMPWPFEEEVGRGLSFSQYTHTHHLPVCNAVRHSTKGRN